MAPSRRSSARPSGHHNSVTDRTASGRYSGHHNRVTDPRASTTTKRLSVSYPRRGHSRHVYNAPATTQLSAEAIAAAPLDELPHLDVSPETAAFHEAFDAWTLTPEASEGMHYGINFRYPPATMTRLDAVRPRRAPYAYDVLSVVRETGFYYTVRWKSGYALRSRRPLIRVEDVCPAPSPLYIRAPRDGTMTMFQSLDGSVVDEDIMAEYYEALDALPFTKAGKGHVDRGLIVRDDVTAGDFILEYTGNRIAAKQSYIMHDAMDELRMNCDRLVKVPSERATIDPRGCGNEAMCVNHSCVPNAHLTEVAFGKRVVVMLRALVDIHDCSEVTIDYGYKSLMSHSIIICECGHPTCRKTI